METNPENKKQTHYRPIVGIAVVSLLMGGVFFPLLVTAVGQLLFPSQANGSLVKLDGKVVGSEYIAQGFPNASVFFQPRNSSASGVDPDITVQDAMSQIPTIANATSIPSSALVRLVDSNTDKQGKFVGLQYVNVLSLNIQLIEDYPSVYASYG